MIVCTNSRSLQKEEALYATSHLIREVVKHGPSFIYKKIDSVLRGYVMDEIRIQMQLTGKNKVLIFPANPSLNRTVNSGEYFIDGKPVTETGFSKDPEFPVKSPFIKNMLGDESVLLLKHHDDLPNVGLVVAEAVTMEDTLLWSAKMDRSWMLAGAGDFYTALLQKDHPLQPQQKTTLQTPHLYVCGTALEERKEFIKSLNNCSFMPDQVNEDWLQQTGAMLRLKGKAILAVRESEEPAQALRTTMAKAVKEIVKREKVKELFIEGGATAASVLEELDIKKLTPVHELSRGVVSMKAGSPKLEGLRIPDLLITVKPGSYQLPEELLKLYS
jgi:uncharacterized protein YgbK (DUF1537 family)